MFEHDNPQRRHVSTITTIDDHVFSTIIIIMFHTQKTKNDKSNHQTREGKKTTNKQANICMMGWMDGWV